MTAAQNPGYAAPHGGAPTPFGYAWLDADLCVNVRHVLAVQAMPVANDAAPATTPRTRVLVGASQSFVVAASVTDVLARLAGAAWMPADYDG